MHFFGILLRGLNACLFSIALMQPSQAALIDVPNNSSACCIGEYSPTTHVTSYWAQTFIVPAAKVGDLKLLILNNEQFPGSVFDFHLLVTETDSSHSAFQPTSILYESSTISVSDRFPTEFTFDLSELTFVQGIKYAFVIDTYATRNGFVDIGQFYVNTIPSAYVGGELYTLFATEQGRKADFNATWMPTSLDMSFSLEASKLISAVPEPETNVLILAGLGLMGVMTRRRKAMQA
ncbi:PEP-CTERM sorting domain-containing protein [Candidatus Nitrotoga sp. 1052]|uniref:PEP-CTERM sorting domain-containing protein n=1 Tax=Candidatus Nitrotoga sp. 1052 TaxID=2886964 RepID=UPI001EF55046|nr:PEP-CTERM sorting domain-containing protein [Candidatus Nitrotoga sp. 1052]